jgi:hypothetical protein
VALIIYLTYFSGESPQNTMKYHLRDCLRIYLTSLPILDAIANIQDDVNSLQGKLNFVLTRLEVEGNQAS